MKHVSLTAAAMLAAFVLASAPAVRAATTGHLYVHPRGGVLERFTLHNGLPASKPDLTYPGINGLLATSADGTLFGMHGGYTVVAFPLGSNKAARRIDIPRLTGCASLIPSVNAIAADVNGFLYVTLSGYFSGAKRQPKFAQPMLKDGYSCNGYNVFGPHQHGFATPLYAHDLGGQYLPSVSVDSHENMYILNYADNAVVRYTTPLVQPSLAGTFNLGILQEQVLTDASNNAVILYIGESHDTFNIAVFPPGSNGQGPPSNDFVPEFTTLMMTVREPYIYACGNSTVDIYNEFANGNQMPIAQLPLSAGCDEITAGR